MEITFYGAVREVTGSMHLLKSGQDRILFDCGMFQGRRKESYEKNRVMPVDPTTITNVLLSHAHIDHSGRLPVLMKQGFNGRILCTRATADACTYLLLDAAHIQESDASYLNYKALRNHLTQMKRETSRGKKKQRDTREIQKILKKKRHQLDVENIDRLMADHGIKSIRPLYTTGDAENTLEIFDGYPYEHPFSVGKGITCTFYDAGHILGSAFSMLRLQQNGKSATVCYTGDIGRFGKSIIRDPTTSFAEEDRDVDLLIMESTYGDRLHEPVKDLKPGLKRILTETLARGGSMLIPSFAFGRTQELLYTLHELYKEGETPRVPIYVDSPLATKLTRVFGEHPEVYDADTHKTFLKDGRNPFSQEQIHFVSSVEESMALNREEKPHIVISASGMCEAGRILHHLRYKIHNPKHTILIVGYMAANTLGRRILEQGTAYQEGGRKGPPPLMKILNKEYPLEARVVKLGGFSAHADKKEMCQFLNSSNLKIKKIALVHGEEDQSLSFAETLKGEGYNVFVPKVGESVSIG
ncbi:MAG: MBL fold metallo-hydrolase [Deltaproteobacteria bacterium]|nr:MAG: MBL fold metallo-hydrolase [Deltaproteobacteria bacterium]